MAVTGLLISDRCLAFLLLEKGGRVCLVSTA